jgi:ubiquinone/menaquinone biosynthesis C-methylase UbiE
MAKRSMTTVNHRPSDTILTKAYSKQYSAATVRYVILQLVRKFTMSVFKKVIKISLLAGALGVGLHTVSRKLRLPEKIADLAHAVEAVPFPGTKAYTFLAAREFIPLYMAVAEDILDKKTFEHILDVNTGPGYLPIELALKNPQISAIGVDHSPDIIHIAEANARAFRVTKSVQFVTGSTTNLPFPGRYFDLVVSTLTFHHWRDPLSTFEEVFHVLKPGGEFWIYDYQKNVPEETWNALRDKLSWIQKLILLFEVIPSSKAAYTKEEVTALAQQTPFEIVDLSEVTLPLLSEPMPVFSRFRFRKPATSSTKPT